MSERAVTSTLATKSEAARHLGFTAYVVDQALNAGKLTEISFGRQRWITRASIDDLARELGLPPCIQQRTRRGRSLVA